MPDCGKPPARLVIPACIGCGAMRRDESCPGGCSERRTELVNGADYDKLAAAAAACHDRLRELRAVAGELAQAEPADGGWKAAYEALQRSARSALRRSATPAPGGRDDPFAPVPAAVVWRSGLRRRRRPAAMHRGLHLAPGRMDRCSLLRTGTLARRRRPPGRAVPGRPAWQARVHNAAGRAMGTEPARPSSPGTEHPASSLTRPPGSPTP